MKQPNGPILPLIPTRGDEFFRDDNTLHFCFVDGVWEQISGSGGAESRTYYDMAPAGIYNGLYPYTSGQFNDTNMSSAPRLVNNWARYTDCSFLVNNFTTEVQSVHSFPTLNDWVDWKNANIPHGGSPDSFSENASLSPFDTIDETIPTVTRLYGINNRYVSMRGKNIGGVSHMGNGSRGEDILYDIWDHFWPTLSAFFSSADFVHGANGRKACWTSTNNTRLYAMPKVGEIVYAHSTSSYSGGRHSANENWEGFNPITPAFSLNIVDRCFVYIDAAGTSWNIRNNPNDKRGKQTILVNGGTGFTVFKIQGNGSIGERQIAILVKPMGIDRIWLPYFDPTLYDMEVVWHTNQDNQPDTFRKIAWAEFNVGSGSTPHPNSGMFINKSSFLPQGGARYFINLRHARRSNRLSMYFRLRDKASKKVGRVSPAHIEVRLNETNAPVKLVVTQDING